jgi:hypothetical protein
MQTQKFQYDTIHHLACGIPVDITASWTGQSRDKVIAIMANCAAEIAERRFEYREQARIDAMFDARYSGDDE